MEKIYFKSEVILNESDINLLSEVIKDIHQQKFLYISLKKVISSKSMKLCTIFLGKKIVSFAIYLSRKWIINNLNYQSISIGYVTTLPEFQSKGYAKMLFNNIEKLCKEKKNRFFISSRYRELLY